MNKRLKFGEIKEINSDEHSITAHVSTFEWDRYDEKFAKGAWMLQNFLNNPVVLWAHKSGEPPIAKSVNIQEDDKGLVSKMVFDMESDFAKSIFSLYKRGFLKAFSVGFWPDWNQAKFEPIEGTNRKGLVWGKAELLEYSAVPIPANPGATVDKDLKDTIVKVFGDSSIFQKDGGYEIQPWKIPGDVKDSAPENLVIALKNMIDLSKIVKKDQLDEQKISLIYTSIDVIKDNLIGDYRMNGITKNELKELRDIVDSAGKLLTERYPDVNDLVSKFMLQLTQAIKS